MATYIKTMNTNKGPLWTLAKDRTQTLRWWAKQKTSRWWALVKDHNEHKHNEHFNNIWIHSTTMNQKITRSIAPWRINENIGTFWQGQPLELLMGHGVKWVNLLWAWNIHTHRDTTMPFIVFKLTILGTTIPSLLIHKPYF
jgi:hypothetical protein